MTEYEGGYRAGYHQAFIECANIMKLYVDNHWIGHPADIIRDSEKLIEDSTYDIARSLIEKDSCTPPES